MHKRHNVDNQCIIYLWRNFNPSSSVGSFNDCIGNIVHFTTVKKTVSVVFSIWIMDNYKPQETVNSHYCAGLYYQNVI